MNTNTNPPNPNDDAELTNLARAICEDHLRATIEHLAPIAEAVWCLNTELRLDPGDLQNYCEQEFCIPPNLLMALVEYHQSSVRNQRAVTGEDQS